MMKAIVMLAGVFAANLAWAEPALCKVAPTSAMLPETHQFKVAGQGRLYFHSAPDERCIDKKTFVIPGDALLAHKIAGEHAEWVSVNFTAKNGDEFSGWVTSKRLMFVGAFGGNMSAEDAADYKKAAAAAKAGKLGMP
jgi:hypothetical protein